MKNEIKLNQTKQMLIFSKWNRKAYSVFNSLKVLIKITAICIAYNIIMSPHNAMGQMDTTISKKLKLDEIVVSAQKAPVVYSKLARQVISIGNEEIKLMPISNINDLLENISGIDIRQRGANGIQADLSVRGGSFDQNLILLNGVNISDPQTGHHSLNLPIDLNSIEKIEVLEGSGSRVFGPNAFSGAINIITTGSTEDYTKLFFKAGDFGLFTGGVSSSLKIKNTSHFLSFTKSKSKGYTKNTDYDLYNLFYNSLYKSELGKVNFQIGYTDKEFGANSFYTPAYPDQFEQTKTTFTSLQFETGDKIKLLPTIYYRRHQDRFELFRYEPESWYTGHNYHLTDVYGLKLDSRIKSKIGTTTLGAELRSENIWSNVLGYDMDEPIDVIGEKGAQFTKKYSRTISNYFIEHSYYVNKVTITGGMLASWVSENDFDFNVYPGIDLSYSFTNWIRVYGSVNRSLRLPTFTDLFYSGPSNTGNENLKPEDALSYELGVKSNTKNITASISAFYRDAKNIIAWVKPNDALPEDKWQTQNLTDVETFGIQVSSDFDLSNDFVRNININYSYLTQDANSKEYETKYSLNYLKHNLIINVNHKIISDLTFAWSAKFQDRAGSYLNYDRNAGDYIGEEKFEPFVLFDAKLNYGFKNLTIFAELNNVFNTQYVDIANVIMPGRWFSTGATIRIAY